jgi:hypothetical protein
MARRYYSSTAAPTALSSPVSNSAVSLVVAATTGFPGSFPYTLIVDPDTASEEVVEVTAASGTTLTVVRGRDGTSGQSHTAGAVVKHGVSARDFDEPNAHIQEGDGANPHGLPDSAWDTDGAWASWTPSWADMTVGNSTVIARFKQVGKTVHWNLTFTVGSTASFTATAGTFTLPTTAIRPSAGVGWLNFGNGYIVGCSTTVATPLLSSSGAGAFTTATSPLTGTVYAFSGTYQAV